MYEDGASHVRRCAPRRWHLSWRSVVVVAGKGMEGWHLDTYYVTSRARDSLAGLEPGDSQCRGRESVKHHHQHIIIIITNRHHRHSSPLRSS